MTFTAYDHGYMVHMAQVMELLTPNGARTVMDAGGDEMRAGYVQAHQDCCVNWRDHVEEDDISYGQGYDDFMEGRESRLGEAPDPDAYVRGWADAAREQHQD